MLWYFSLPSESFLWLPQKQQGKSSVHTGNLHQKLSEVLPLDIPISIKTISGRLKKKKKNIQERPMPGKTLTNDVV